MTDSSNIILDDFGIKFMLYVTRALIIEHFVAMTYR